jgi:hypothetical protein
VWCAGCVVHQGFLEMYLGLRSQMMAALSALGAADSISLSGHSLGAVSSHRCS